MRSLAAEEMGFQLESLSEAINYYDLLTLPATQQRTEAIRYSNLPEPAM